MGLSQARGPGPGTPLVRRASAPAPSLAARETAPLSNGKESGPSTPSAHRASHSPAHALPPNSQLLWGVPPAHPRPPHSQLLWGVPLALALSVALALAPGVSAQGCGVGINYGVNTVSQSLSVSDSIKSILAAGYKSIKTFGVDTNVFNALKGTRRSIPGTAQWHL